MLQGEEGSRGPLDLAGAVVAQLDERRVEEARDEAVAHLLDELALLGAQVDPAEQPVELLRAALLGEVA